MSLTGIKTRPQLAGTLASLGPWASLFGRAGFRVYPFQLGCMVRSASTGTTVLTDGLGDFRQNDYLIVCSPVAYGDSTLFQPVLSKITRVTSDPTAATDDTLTISPAVAVSDGDYLLNIGADGAAAPLATPNYDGSLLTLYTDPAGNTANANDYLLTGENGHFFGWLESAIAGSVSVVDLLIANSSGVPQLVLPLTAVGPSIGGAESSQGGVTVQPVSGNNNQGPINAAIAAVSAAGGGIVQLAPGTFNISSAIFIKSNVWLRGSGWATTIKVAAEFADIVPATGNLEHLYGMISAGDRGSEYTFTNPIVNARVSDIAFDYQSFWVYAAIKVGKCNDFLAENLLLNAHSVAHSGGRLAFGIELDPTATATSESLGSGRLVVRGNTFKGFEDFNANIISITGGTAGAHEIIIEGNTFDTCVAYCIATPNGLTETISIVNNVFYACSYPINLESPNPDYVRRCLIANNVMTGLPLTASPSGFNSLGKIAIWINFGTAATPPPLSNAIQITGNIISGYQEIVHGTPSYMRFTNNYCYDWGMGPSGGSGLVLGTSNTLEAVTHIAIENNYFTQTNQRISGSAFQGTINIDSSDLLGTVSFASPTSHDVTGPSGSWTHLRVGDTVRFNKTGGLNTNIDVVITGLTSTVLSASATTFNSEASVSGYTVSKGPNNNISIRNNWFDGQDTTAGLAPQHVIFANVVGSNWIVENNSFYRSTLWPIRLGGGYGLSNSSISRNDFTDCNAIASGFSPQTLITCGTALADSRVVVQNNTATDSLGGRIASLFSTNNVAGSTYIIGPNYCPDASAGIVSSGSSLVQQGITQGIFSAAGQLFPVNDVIPFNSAGSFTLTSVPTITDGYKGQIITIINVDVGDITTFQDQSILAGSNLILATLTAALAPREFLSLYFDGTDWIEISRTQALSKTPLDLQAIVTSTDESLLTFDDNASLSEFPVTYDGDIVWHP